MRLASLYSLVTAVVEKEIGGFTVNDLMDASSYLPNITTALVQHAI